MLYLVATPIGNLGDITYRAVDTLKACDYILCEDTRHSLPLLSHYQIRKPLKSYHKFNEKETETEILKDLKEGKAIGLISDAGTPGISDPGEKLVQRCLQEKISVFSIPGPCAAITALNCSGLDTSLFQFRGFLPKKSQELKTLLQSILQYEGTTICYESPHRLLKTLEVIQEIAPDRLLVVARELTKKFEERRSGTPSDLINHWKTHPLKGEVVLLFSGYAKSPQDWTHLSPEQHVVYLEQTFGMPRKEAIKMAAEQRDVPKKIIYNSIHHP